MGAPYASAIEELAAPGTKKFRTAKRLLKVSEERPATLDPHFDALRRLPQGGEQHHPVDGDPDHR